MDLSQPATVGGPVLGQVGPSLNSAPRLRASLELGGRSSRFGWPGLSEGRSSWVGVKRGRATEGSTMLAGNSAEERAWQENEGQGTEGLCICP